VSRSSTGRGGILACFFLLALANCAGGGGGDSGGGGGVVADFVPACLTSDACYADSVTLQKSTASGDTVEVQAVLNKLNTTIGEAQLLIGFDPTVADYKGYTEGPALGTVAQGTVYQVTESSGEVLVDILPPAGGKSVTVHQVIVTLSFRALKAGSTNLTFKTPNTLSGSALFSTTGAIISLGSGGWPGGLLIGT